MVTCAAHLKFLVNKFVERASKLFSGLFRCRGFAKLLQFFFRPRYRTTCTTFSTWGMRRSVRWIMAELVSKCARLCNQAYSASNYMLPRVKTNLYVIRLCTRMENRYPWDTGSECIGLYSPTLANQSQTESVVYVFLRTCDLCYNRVFKQYGLSTIANGTQTSNAKLKFKTPTLPNSEHSRDTERQNRGYHHQIASNGQKQYARMVYVFPTDCTGLDISMEFIPKPLPDATKHVSTQRKPRRQRSIPTPHIGDRCRISRSARVSE